MTRPVDASSRDTRGGLSSGQEIRSVLDAIYVTYWSLNDPLCQSQSLPVVRALAEDGRSMGLVTFEQERWALEARAGADSSAALKREGILWLPLRYHKRPRLLATTFDVLHGTWLCARMSVRLGVRLVHGRGTVSAAIAHLAARITRARFFYDADGPLSEEYADAGVWRAGSIGHRLTRCAERRLFRTADAVAVLTTRRRDEVATLTTREVVVLPCGVDTAHFRFLEDRRRAHRSALGLGGRVFVYSGRVSPWYEIEAMLDFVVAATRAFGECTLLVVTCDDPGPFTSGAAERGIRCVVTRAGRAEMPGLLSAADAGLAFTISTPSKAAASPVKNGEYLACGLPIVTTPGIGDYSDLIRRRSVGVVLPRLDRAGYEEASALLAGLFMDSGVHVRCREAAVTEVSMSHVVLPRYRGVYRSLLDPDPGRG